MPLRVQCPGCDKKMEVPDTVRGKTIRCSACTSTFKIDNSVILSKVSSAVDDDEDETPKPKKKKAGDVRGALDSMGNNRKQKARPVEDDDDDADDSAKPKTALIIAAVAGVLLVGGVAIYFMTANKVQQVPPNNQLVVNNNPPVNPIDLNRPIVPNNNGVANPFDPMMPNNGGGNPFEPVNPNNGGGNPFVPVNPGVPANPFQNPDDVAEVAANGNTPWTAKPDLLAAPIEIPEGAAFAINFPKSTDGVLFPSSPSPFFALGANTNDQSGRLLYNLTTMPKNTKTLVKHVGMLKGRLQGINDDTSRMSADGKYMIAKTGSNSFEVWSFADSNSVYKKEMPQGSIEWLDFGPTSDQVVVYHGTYGSKDRYTLQVWDIEKDAMLHSIPMPKDRIDKDAFAVSANRRYVGFGSRALGYVGDMMQGKMAGVFKYTEHDIWDKPEKSAGRTKCKGVAFSPDGKQISALITTDIEALVSACEWSMTDGKLLAEHDLSDYLSLTVMSGRSYSGPEIEYLPDSQAWLIAGNLIVDRVSGLTLTKLDSDDSAYNAKERKILPGNIIAQKAKGRSGDGFVSAKFDRATYDNAVKAARGDSGPKLETKESNLAVAKKITVNRNVKYDVTPDIATSKGILGPVPVTSKGNVSSIYFSKPSVAQALVFSVQEITTPFIRKVARADRYDLVSKRSLGGFDLNGIVKLGKNSSIPKILADISPEGALCAVKSLREPSRIDLYSADGKHTFGFEPHSADHAKIEWLGFASDKILITLSDNGKIVAWDVTNAQAVYTIDGNYSGPLTLSANRRYLAAFAASEVEIFEAQTGDVRGIVATGVVPPQKQAGLAFRSESGLLAAAIPSANAKANLVTWDAKGQPSPAFEVYTTFPNILQWCGDKFLLLGGTDLIDLETNALVWNYTGAGPLGSGPLPDSRVWLIGGVGTPLAGRLGGVRIPNNQLAQNLQLAKAPNTEKLMQPGGAISVRADNAKDPTMVSRLSANLTAAGFKVGANAPVTLVITGTESPSGEQMELSSFGGGPGGKRMIPIPKIEATASLVDRQGQTLWSAKNTVKSFNFFRIFRGNEDPAVTIANETWNLYSSWALTLRLPSSIYRASGQVLTLPGTSAFPIE